jgi:hypothetical protein
MARIVAATSTVPARLEMWVERTNQTLNARLDEEQVPLTIRRLARPAGSAFPIGQVVHILRGLVQIDLVNEGTTEFAFPGDTVFLRPDLAATAASRLVRTMTITLPPVQGVLLKGPPDEWSGSAKRFQRLARYRTTDTPVIGRLARLLLDCDTDAPEDGSDHALELVATQATLARAIGASRASVENSLAVMRHNNILTTKYRRYAICDTAAMRTLAGDPEPQKPAPTSL